MRLCSCPLASPALQALAHPVLGHTGFLQSLPKALALPLLENRIALEDAHLHPAVTTSRPQLLGTPREILEPVQLDSKLSVQPSWPSCRHSHGQGHPQSLGEQRALIRSLWQLNSKLFITTNIPLSGQSPPEVHFITLGY